MRHPAGHAGQNGVIRMSTTQWEHHRQADDGAGGAEGQAKGIAEQDPYQQHPQQGDGAGVPKTQPVEGEDGHRVGQPQLHTRGGYRPRDEIFQIAQCDGQRHQNAISRHFLCLHGCHLLLCAAGTGEPLGVGGDCYTIVKRYPNYNKKRA